MRRVFAGSAMALGALLGGAALAQTAGAPASAGQQLYANECGICHDKGGTGTLMLERRLGPSDALLAQRTDLEADYVKTVVRNGLNSMPAITRVEVTDEELEQIASYLTRQGPKERR